MLGPRCRGSRMPGRGEDRPPGGFAGAGRSAGSLPPSLPSPRDSTPADGSPRLPPAFATSQPGSNAPLRCALRPFSFFRSVPDGSPPRAEAWRRALRTASPCGRRAGRCGPSGGSFPRRLCPARTASARHPASLRRPGCSPPAHARCGFAVRSESGLGNGTGNGFFTHGRRVHGYWNFTLSDHVSQKVSRRAGRGTVDYRTKTPHSRKHGGAGGRRTTATGAPTAAPMQGAPSARPVRERMRRRANSEEPDAPERPAGACPARRQAGGAAR